MTVAYAKCVLTGNFANTGTTAALHYQRRDAVRSPFRSTVVPQSYLSIRKMILIKTLGGCLAPIQSLHHGAIFSRRLVKLDVANRANFIASVFRHQSQRKAPKAVAANFPC